MREPTKTLVPKLRFLEFKDAREWEEKRLEDVCTKISQGGTPDTTNLDYWNGDVEWLTPAEMGKLETRFITTTNRKISRAGLKNCSSDLLPIDSVILSTRAPIGHLLINKSEMAINQGCKGLMSLPSTDHNYLYYILASNKNALADLGAGNTFKELSGSALKNFKIKIPKHPEQQKIADCLSSIDALITAQTQKIAALKNHKKGLMQQLFPAEGETVPKLRFPEFQHSGEWERKPLGEVATFYNGRAYKQEELLDQGKYRVLRVGNFFTNKNWYYSDLELDEDKYCDNGNLLYAWSASFGPRIWKGEKVIYHYHIWKVVEKPAIHKDFLFTILNFETEKLKSQSANGLGLMHITKGAIESWEFSLPKPDEQQKIADCLSSIDELIATQTQKLEALKTQKNGLMQQLFPNADEVNE